MKTLEELIVALEEKSAGKRNQVGDLWGDWICKEAAAAIRELIADAERYRWLRVWPHNYFPEEQDLDGEKLDAAIDNARNG